MLDKNDEICLKSDELLEFSEILDYVVVSLNKIGSCLPDLEEEEQWKIVQNFMVNWQPLPLLAKMRSSVSRILDEQGFLDEDAIDQLDLQRRKYWSLSDQDPPREMIERILHRE